MDWLPLLKVALAFAVLLLASWSDWRTREASDLHWIFLGLAGMAFLITQLLVEGADPLYYLILIPIAIFFLDIFWERRETFGENINLLPLALYLLSFTVLGILVFLRHDDLYFWQLMIIPIMFLLFILLYQFDIIKGGADAKAFIALSILFPLYPVIGELPMIALPTEMAQFIMPFPMLILFNAALFTLVVPFVLALYNLGKGDFRFPAILFGYRMKLDEARRKFVWPMEYVMDGEVRMAYLPKGSEHSATQLDELEATGAKEVWVTPKIPFLIPITISIIFSTVVGNILFLFIH